MGNGRGRSFARRVRGRNGAGQGPCDERGRAGSDHQLIVGGKVVFEHEVPAARSRALDRAEPDRRAERVFLDRGESVRARPLPARPTPRRHTNPVYVDIGDKAPYDRDSLDHLVARIDQQMAVHRKRTFAEKARVLDDFQKSRDILLRIRRHGGLPAGGVPDRLDRRQDGRGDRPQPADAHRRRANAVPPAALGQDA